ncbi:MAG: hypothetical protein ACREYE_32180, partial [Gammaproteobacteria bacterium]
MIDQAAEGVFKTVWNDLLVKIHQQKFQTFVNGFVASHPNDLPMKFSASNYLMGNRVMGVFLQPQR